MVKKFGLDAEDLHKMQKKAEADLKDRLIRSDSNYEELVLRDKSSRNVEVSEEFTKEFFQWQEWKNETILSIYPRPI